MPFCNKCGNEIAENIKFCPKCGNTQQCGQNSNPSNGNKPSLWGPTAAVNLSVLLFPLGAFLHYQNWKALKQESKAKTSLIWFICLIVSMPFSAFGVSILALIAWYLTSAKGQIKYVKEKYGTEYNKKSLLKPFGVIVGVYAVIIVIVLIVAGASSV